MTNAQELTDAIYNDLAPWEKTDVSRAEILEMIENDPLEVVKYLVDRFILEA